MNIPIPLARLGGLLIEKGIPREWVTMENGWRRIYIPEKKDWQWSATCRPGSRHPETIELDRALPDGMCEIHSFLSPEEALALIEKSEEEK